MAIKIYNQVDINNTIRFLDSIQEDLSREENWDFSYPALNKDVPTPRDLMTYGGEYNENKSVYPQPIGDKDGTIFFDSTPGTVRIISSVQNVVFDTTPPEITGTDFASVIFTKYGVKDFKGKIVVNSDTLLDLCKFEILVQPKVKEFDVNRFNYNDNGSAKTLIKIDRFEPNIEIHDEIKNLKVNRNGNTYTFTFNLDGTTFKDTISSLKVQFYDICGNSTGLYETDTYEWTTIDTELTEEFIKHLIIEFIEVYPENRVISEQSVGYTIVKVYNPNKELWAYQPHVELAEGSIGTIDTNTMLYDSSTGVLTFKVKDIYGKGPVIVDAWIDFSKLNSDIAPILKALTFAEAILDNFITKGEGRLYKFKPYIPKYMQNDKYGAFVMFTELFLNTSQESLNNGNAISTLEKIARINNFNDIDRIENPLIQYYKKQFNIEIKPNFNDLVTFLANREDIKQAQIKQKKDE